MTNDVCTVFPALSLVGDGYEVQVIADAGGSPSKMDDDMALRHMANNGVTLSSTNLVIAEWAGNRMYRIPFDHIVRQAELGCAVFRSAKSS